jgi:hypothetical protein
MLPFLLNNEAITVAVITGVFTTALLNSFRFNIVDQISESVAPANELHPVEGAKPTPPVIKWKLFLRDLVVWIIVMIILSSLWTNVLAQYKKT